MSAEEISASVPIFGGADLRARTLLDAVLVLVRERGGGMPFPTVLGVMRLAEHYLILEEAQK